MLNAHFAGVQPDRRPGKRLRLTWYDGGVTSSPPGGNSARCSDGAADRDRVAGKYLIKARVKGENELPEPEFRSRNTFVPQHAGGGSIPPLRIQ